MAAPQSQWENFLEVLVSFDLAEWTDWIGGDLRGWGISRCLFLSVLYVGLLLILNTQIPNLALFTFSWIVGTAPVWLPFALIVGFYRVWVWYAHSLYLFNRKPVLLEMKIPREITKSPRAMETALTHLWTASHETTFIMRAVQGQVRPFYSFEMASFGGDIHFYVMVWKEYQNMVEAALYSQYPEIELVEVEDYSQKFTFNPETQTCYCTDWRLEPYRTNIDAYPIKTYIDLELEQDPKEEFKVDPLATVLEYMSSIKPTQQVWIQIIFTASFRTGTLNAKESMWRSMVEHEVEKIRVESSTFKEGGDIHATEEQLKVARPRATWKQTQQIETMERNLGKHPFDVGLRGVYISPDEDFGKDFWGLRWIWRPFANPQYMSQLRCRRWHNPIDFPYQDFHDFRWNMITTRFFDAYRRRSYFYTPWETPPNMMTSEVIATLFHPPSRTIVTPGITRVSAKKAEAPPNLPK